MWALTTVSSSSPFNECPPSLPPSSLHRSAAGGDVLERHILLMTQDPTPLLKFGKGGKPGFRAFQLSPDLLALTWQSKNKSAAKTRVDIKDMKEIRYGQRTEKFKKNNRPDLENLSFSVMYTDGGVQESLDLVCRDESEFQMWYVKGSKRMENV